MKEEWCGYGGSHMDSTPITHMIQGLAINPKVLMWYIMVLIWIQHYVLHWYNMESCLQNKASIKNSIRGFNKEIEIYKISSCM